MQRRRYPASAAYHEPAATLVRRNLTDKNVAFIVVVAVFAFLTAVALLIVIIAKGRKRRQRAEQQKAEHHEHDVVDIMPGAWHSGGSQNEQSRGSDDAGGRQSAHRLSQPLSRLARGGSRGRMSEANRSRVTVHGGAGVGLSSRASRNTVASDADVDRSASIRSVMTLPPYSSMASTSEQVLGREGERDGIDVVIALPTDEDHEALREEEMDALYQIRLARRRQLNERDELRRQQMEARRRNDGEALAEIRAQSRATVNTCELDDLRREVGRIQESRQRSVSRVSYADLGVARPDGTRIRANSNESERMGLLSDAASIDVSGQSGASSLLLHRRGRSASSLVSIDSDLVLPASTRPRGGSHSEAPPPSRGADSRQRWTPAPGGADLSEVALPPPEYYNVPLDDESSPSPSPLTNPLSGPPPDYPGPAPRAIERGSRGARPSESGEAEAAEPVKRPTGRRSGGIPQLPSLRISSLPAIVIEPASAQPLSR